MSVTPDADRTGDAERLRHGVNRLARLMRQQDDGDLGATSTAALATVRKRGPVTLGELASLEQVVPADDDEGGGEAREPWTS